MRNKIGMPVVWVVLLASLLTMAGCVRTLMDFTLISTRNVDLSRMEEYERTARPHRGRDVVHWVLFFPLSWTGEPDLKAAIDRAILSVPGGVALVDGRIKEGRWYIPLLYGQHSIIVEGIPLVDPKAVLK